MYKKAESQLDFVQCMQYSSWGMADSGAGTDMTHPYILYCFVFTIHLRQTASRKG